MTISEAEEFISNTDEYSDMWFADTSFVISESDNDMILLCQPAFVFSEYNIVCYEGIVWDKQAEQIDHSVTTVFYNDEFDYIEDNDVATTLHNYFTINGKDIDTHQIECELRILPIEEVTKESNYDSEV